MFGNEEAQIVSGNGVKLTKGMVAEMVAGMPRRSSFVLSHAGDWSLPSHPQTNNGVRKSSSLLLKDYQYLKLERLSLFQMPTCHWLDKRGRTLRYLSPSLMLLLTQTKPTCYATVKEVGTGPLNN